MTLRSKFILTVAATVILLVLTAVYFLLPRNGAPGGTEPVTVAYSPFASGMRFYLACEMMEDEARWMIGNGLTAEQSVPNLLNYIHADALQAVRPEAVTILGR